MTVIRYYVSGNTAEGYKNELASNIEGIEQSVFLNHPSHTLKTFIFNQIIRTYDALCNVEILCSSLSQEYIEGVIIRERSVAIIDGTLDTGDFPDATRTDIMEMQNEKNQNVDILLDIKPQLKELTEKAYKEFETALRIHDNLEAVYIQEMDFTRANQLIDYFIINEVNSIPIENKSSYIYHRLFGTNTSDGAVNVASELMEPLPKRYILKGRAGTGKSVFMKKVAKACEQRGLDVEQYHCSFDPTSIDMILIRGEFCIMDGTSPHEISPDRTSDVVIDLYEETVTPGTDEKYASEIQDITARYKSHMKTGLNLLKETGYILSDREKLYKNMISEEVLKEAVTKVLALVES